MKEEQNRVVVVTKTAKTAFKIAQVVIAISIIVAAIILIVSTGRPRVARGLWLKTPPVLTATPAPLLAVDTAEPLGALR